MSNDIHPDFPVVEGRYQMTDHWQVDLPEKFNRRFEDGSLVLWRQGLTFWIFITANPNNIRPEEKLKYFNSGATAGSYDFKEKQGEGMNSKSYRLDEARDGQKIFALNGCVASMVGSVLVAIYADAKKELNRAEAIWDTVRPV